MEGLTQGLQSLFLHARDILLWLWSAVIGVIFYLVEPTAAFWALLVVMIADMACRLMTEAVKAGGFFKAIKRGSIRSKALFRGTAVKFVGYFILAVVVHQFKRVVMIEQVSVFMATVIYSFLFLVESISVIENLIEAGLKSLRPLLFRFESERDRLGQIDNERKW